MSRGERGRTRSSGLVLSFRCARIGGWRHDARCLIALSTRHRPLFLSLSRYRGLTSSTSCATREPHARTHARTDGWTGDHRLPTIARDVSQPPSCEIPLFSSFPSSDLSRALGVTVARRGGRDESPGTRSVYLPVSLSLSVRVITRNLERDCQSTTTRPALTLRRSSWPLCTSQRSAVTFDPDCNVFGNRCATSPSATTLPSPTQFTSVRWPWRHSTAAIVLGLGPQTADSALSLTDANLRESTW